MGYYLVLIVMVTLFAAAAAIATARNNEEQIQRCVIMLFVSFSLSPQQRLMCSTMPCQIPFPFVSSKTEIY